MRNEINFHNGIKNSNFDSNVFFFFCHCKIYITLDDPVTGGVSEFTECSSYFLSPLRLGGVGIGSILDVSSSWRKNPDWDSH